MAKQSVNATQSSFWLKLHNHILLIGGLGALIPFTNLTTGMVLAESKISNSANSSNSLKPMQVSKAKANPKQPEPPNYESVPDLELEEKESASDSALAQTSQSKRPDKIDNTTKANPQDHAQESNLTSSPKSTQTQTKPGLASTQAVEAKASQNKTDNTTQANPQDKAQKKSQPTSSQESAKTTTNSNSASTQALEASAPQKGSKAQDKATSTRSPQQASEPLTNSAKKSSSPSVEVDSNEKQTSSSSKAEKAEDSKPNVDQDSLQKTSKGKLQPKSDNKKQLKVIEPLDSSSANSPDVSNQPKSSAAAKQNQQQSSSPNTVESSSNKDSKPNSSSPTVEKNQPNNSSQASTEQSSSSGVQEFSAPKTQSEPKTSSSQKTATDNFVDNQGAPLSGDKSLPAPQAPQVKVTDRAQGCTTVVEGGEMKQRNCQPSSQKAPSQSDVAQQQSLPGVPQDIAPPKPQQDTQQSTQPQKRNIKNPYTSPEQAPEVERDTDANVLLPLPQGANLSSNFGWRKNPISGNRDFHTGVDFVAAKGTPVIAARSGRVTIASYQGGYGVMVELNHKNDQSKSRYAHLSTTHVKPGEWVEKGTVIGQVGSTGHSSGPHLHFEWQVPKNGRWVAVDPKPSLFTAMDEIVSNPMAWKDNHNPDNYVQGYIQGKNWFNSLSVMVTSISSEPAQWTSLPELPFIDQNNFDQPHQRSTQLSWFSENQDSVLGFSYSLPQAFASLLNWEPPQLFESPKEQTFHQASFDAASVGDGTETFNQPLSNRHNLNQVPAKQHRSLASIQQAN